ncbi:MAG: hypothetical protein LBC68_02735 [Prevotellaceae bacterium]|jgi:hypothetical protein|nr:hypothetical protein [Prevotellaceae bacterium]
MNKKTEDTILARWFDNGNKNEVTIKDYLKYVEEKNKEKIAEFIYQRLYTRYLKPLEYNNDEYKNGFAIMANCCLLIETLQSFRDGLGNSDGQSGKLFEKFFKKDNIFKEHKDFQKIDFYHNIRCGILHQGETTGGWKIERGSVNESECVGLINIPQHTIDSEKFAENLNESLKAYSNELKDSVDWYNELWENFRCKMRFIISHCDK